MDAARAVTITARPAPGVLATVEGRVTGNAKDEPRRAPATPSPPRWLWWRVQARASRRARLGRLAAAPAALSKPSRLTWRSGFSASGPQSPYAVLEVLHRSTPLPTRVPRARAPRLACVAAVMACPRPPRALLPAAYLHLRLKAAACAAATLAAAAALAATALAATAFSAAALAAAALAATAAAEALGEAEAC
jgi:hypothetical protein